MSRVDRDDLIKVRTEFDGIWHTFEVERTMSIRDFSKKVAEQYFYLRPESLAFVYADTKMVIANDIKLFYHGINNDDVIHVITNTSYQRDRRRWRPSSCLFESHETLSKNVVHRQFFRSNSQEDTVLIRNNTSARLPRPLSLPISSYHDEKTEQINNTKSAAKSIMPMQELFDEMMKIWSANPKSSFSNGLLLIQEEMKRKRNHFGCLRDITISQQFSQKVSLRRYSGSTNELHQIPGSSSAPQNSGIANLIPSLKVTEKKSEMLTQNLIRVKKVFNQKFQKQE